MNKSLFGAFLSAIALTACTQSPQVPLTQPPANPRTVSAAQDANLALVLEFYDRFFNRHETIEAAKVIDDRYRQHNPEVPDGKAPFVDYFTGFFEENPHSHALVVRSAANDDLVWLHVHSTNGHADPGQAVVDIFRVKDGKIVEHWDVIQSVPEKASNENTMF